MNQQQFEDALARAYVEFVGQEYRDTRSGNWNFSETLSRFPSLTNTNHARRGQVPTKAYTEHILLRRWAMTDILEQEDEALDIPDDMLEMILTDRNLLDSTVVTDHMLLAAKVIHRYAPDANEYEIDDLLSLAAEKLIRCIATRDRRSAFTTYVWTAIRNLVFRYMANSEDWECINVDLSEDEQPFNTGKLESDNKVCMPGQQFMLLVPDPGKGPLDHLTHGELLRALTKVLEFRTDFLTEMEEKTLSSWSGIGYGIGGNAAVSKSTIAHELGISPQAVHQLINSALEKLKTKLTTVDPGSNLTFFQKYVE